jgi:hypothetical protein
VITQCPEVLRPLTDRRKINVIDESWLSVLNTSATCGYAHQNDKAVVATFIFGLPALLANRPGFWPAYRWAMHSGSACGSGIGSTPDWAVDVTSRRSVIERQLRRTISKKNKRVNCRAIHYSYPRINTLFVYEGSEVCAGKIYVRTLLFKSWNGETEFWRRNSMLIRLSRSV